MPYTADYFFFTTKWSLLKVLMLTAEC
jgi:hypothetical protein